MSDIDLSRMTEVRGGGFHLLTADPFLIAAVRRCAELEEQLRQARHHEVARYRTLRRDVTQIKRAVGKNWSSPPDRSSTT